jgi:hypothetical protein
MSLEGSLRDISFVDLFEIFHASRHSGRLLVNRHIERGLIFIGNGLLFDAVLVTDLDEAIVASAEDALNRILAWPDADFIFEYDLSVNVRPRRIVRDIDWILATATKAAAPLIGLDSLLRPAAPSADAVGPFMLGIEEWRLLSALWPQRTLGMACAELGLTAHHAIGIALSLLDRGLLTPPRDEETPRAMLYASNHTQPALSATPPKLAARPQPAAPEMVSSRSLLLNAIIRRVRAL